MKDLSIEGKAKQYDEAVRKAKDIIKYYKTHNRGGEASIDYLETIFPELKESEDEKIRKSIIKILTEIVVDTNYKKLGIDFSIKDMVAWLEKQGKNNDK